MNDFSTRIIFSTILTLWALRERATASTNYDTAVRQQNIAKTQEQIAHEKEQERTVEIDRTKFKMVASDRSDVQDVRDDRRGEEQRGFGATIR